MALQCLISSYALSVLYLEGIKYGDTQMTALGLLGTVSHLSISRSKPLDKLSRVKPLSSIFHPASFLSLLGQFAIHLLTMVLAVRGAKEYLEDDWEVDLDGQFKPGLLNTVVFLITSVQQVTVFFVNLQGRPFMTGVTENRPLLYSMIATFVLTFMFASESVPGLNRYFQLVPFPNDKFRDYILIILGVDLVATLLLDRFMKFIFARDILRASIEETTMKDVWSLARTFGTLSFLMFMFLGNSDTWDQLLAMEEAQRNGTYDFTTGTIITTNTTETLDSLLDTIENITATAQKITNTIVHDEF
jgi:manganese-transporting P-type ATPase